MERWRVSRPVSAGSHHLDVKQGLDLLYSEKSDPDRHFSEQKDTDRIKVMRILIHNCVRH